MAKRKRKITKEEIACSVNIVYFSLGNGKDIVYHGKTEFRGIHQNDVLELTPFQKQTFKDVYKRQALLLPWPYHISLLTMNILVTSVFILVIVFDMLFHNKGFKIKWEPKI